MTTARPVWRFHCRSRTTRGIFTSKMAKRKSTVTAPAYTSTCTAASISARNRTYVAPTQAKVKSKNSAACMTFLRVITIIAENTPTIAKRKKKKYISFPYFSLSLYLGGRPSNLSIADAHVQLFSNAQLCFRVPPQACPYWSPLAPPHSAARRWLMLDMRLRMG